MAPKSFFSGLFSSRHKEATATTDNSPSSSSSKKSKKAKGDSPIQSADQSLPVDGPTSTGEAPVGSLSKASGNGTSTNGNGLAVAKSKGSKFMRGNRDASPQPPIDDAGGGSAEGSQEAIPGSNNGHPSPPPPLDIPTTQTILANPNASITSAIASSLVPTSSGMNSATPNSARTLDIDDMISRLLDVGYTGKVSKSLCLKQSEINALCLAAREVFLSQPTLIELSPPVKIVGDVHGQYSDLIRLFEMCGFPPQSNYLFLGDYVDRGKQSLETILLLLCYKVKYPENFFLLRGNHECANVTRGSYSVLFCLAFLSQTLILTPFSIRILRRVQASNISQDMEDLCRCLQHPTHCRHCRIEDLLCSRWLISLSLQYG